jgi:hypothetical protein
MRLTIDEQLKLSLYLPTRLLARCQRIDDDGLDPEETDQAVEGLCDIAMFGRTKRQVEHDYQAMLGNFVLKTPPKGAHVEKGGFLCTLPPAASSTWGLNLNSQKAASYAYGERRSRPSLGSTVPSRPRCHRP